MKKLLVGAGLCLSFAACASQRVDHFWYADSAPQGAVVTTDIGLTCVTPCRLEIPRWRKELSSFNYSIEKPGFEPVRGAATIQTNDTFAGGVALSIAMALVGSPTVPGPLDDKGYREIEPNPLRVELVPLASAQTSEIAAR